MPPSAFPDLTDSEREILGMIALGRSNAEIAEELVLSPKTVRGQVDREGQPNYTRIRRLFLS